MANDERTVSFEEQERQGLIKRNPYKNYVPVARSVQGEVLPPVRSVPAVTDPYAAAMPVTVQQVVKYEATPITRAQAMTMKAREVTIFLGVLTACAMYLFQLYPPTWQMFALFVLWSAFVSLEWCVLFALLAILDYRETPAAQNRQQMSAYIDMMKKEQYHRLRAMYPTQFEDKK